MAIKPKHKPREVRKRTFLDKLKDSALFVLFMVLVCFVILIDLVFWISKVLNASDPKFQGLNMFQNMLFYIWVGGGAALTLFFLLGGWYQRRVHG